MDLHMHVSIVTLVIALASLAIGAYLIRKAKWIIGTADRHKGSIDNQFRHLFRHLQLLQALQDELKLAHPLPPTGGKAGSPDFLKALADHVLAARPDLVVECGSGLSTVVAARALQLNGTGRIVSMEHMPKFAEITRTELARQGLSKWATVLDAPLVQQELSGKMFQWYDASRLPEEPIDLLIVDGPPARTGERPRYPAGPNLFPRLSAKGAVIIDDAHRPEELAVIDEWRRRFKHLAFDINVEDFHKGICVAQPRAAAVSEKAEAA